MNFLVATTRVTILGLILALLPDWAAADEAELVTGPANQATVDSRVTDRLLFMGGTGLPDLLHLELDVALARYVFLTGRVSTLVLLYSAASAGVMGVLPLSSDPNLVPRHALGFAVEATSFYVIQLYGTFQEDPFDVTYTAGYLYTSDRGAHVRLSLGSMPGSSSTKIAFGPRVSFGFLF